MECISQTKQLFYILFFKIIIKHNKYSRGKVKFSLSCPIQLWWFCLMLFCFMIDEFFLYYLETSQLICSANCLPGFYLLHGIKRNFRTPCGFFVVTLAGLQCLYLIGSFLLLFFYPYPAIPLLMRGVLNYSS